MRKILKIEIECSHVTCASKPGKFCRYVGITHFGSQYVCMLFSSNDNSHTKLKEKDGWLLRCNECIFSEVN
jgi:hypothetical protein